MLNAERLDQRYPDRFGELRMHRCPWHELREPDPYVTTIVNIEADTRHGAPPMGWPDGYLWWVVDGVRYLRREYEAAQAELMDIVRREAKRGT